MTSFRFRVRTVFAVALFLAFTALTAAQTPHLTTAKEQFGFDIGDDYQLANYTQLSAWWKKLASESDRMKLVEIGKTEEGRPQYMAILTSPENQKKLDHYKEIARKLALAQGLTDAEAHALAHEGKAVVWIDGGLHASEVLGAQQLLEFVWEMVSRNDPETLRTLNDVIIVAVHANPDGMELVSNWYMREPDPMKRSTQNIPRLWEKYAGHDNNRDFYMSNLSESTNMNHVLYYDWFPQIMYNHHQTGPAGAVMFAPPFRDPFNYNFDPLIPLQIEMVGAAMHSRFVAEGKGGTVQRSGSTYSTWYNGGLRTTTYFHNMIGLLTETIGNPTPQEVPLVAERQLPISDGPLPIAPQLWHFRTSIEYSMTANRAVLDLASKYREDFLYNIYRMGRNSIERGNKDSWTVTPKRIAALEEAAKAAGPSGGRGGRGGGGGGGGGGNAPTVPSNLYASVLHDPALRDPRGYIVPSDQPDFPTATKFINTLIKNGVSIQRATRDFEVAGKHYPANSWVVKSAQAFRPHVLDMFEPQDHPNDFQYPGGPPIPPYDVTGYTLAFQMGVQFDRVLEAFDGPFEPVTGVQKAPPDKLRGPAQPTGYLISHQQNDSFVLVNRLLKNGDDVYWLEKPVAVAGHAASDGTMYVPARPQTRPLMERAASELGISIEGVQPKPAGAALKLKPVRIGLWDQYGGSMTSGWLRYIFEQFEFPFQVVYPQVLDSGDLASRFDVLVFPSGAMSRAAGVTEGGRGGGFGRQPAAEEIPDEFRKNLGYVTSEKTIAQLRKFAQSGGTIVTIGDSTALARLFGLPLHDALTERTPDGKEHPLPRDKFYVPGSVLAMSIDNTNPTAYGMPSTADAFFENSPAFRLSPDAELKGVKPVAWYANATPLRSGWAWGQGYLDGAVAAAEAPMGEGKVFLLAVEAAFRGQPHGTFKLLFNSIYAGSAKSATAVP
jgi:Zinc carboxypeptidase